MTEEYRKNHISVQQQCKKDISDINFESYDIAFFCSSWDFRCLNITNIDIIANQAILVNLAFRDTEGLRDRADKELNDYFINHSSVKLNVINQEKLSDHEVLKQMCDFIDSTSVERVQPFRILIDMTGFPRYLSLGLFAYAIKSNQISQVDILYSEASYGNENEDGSISFTEGKWEAVPIKFLEGEYSPCKSMYILVSTGFEGKKTYRAITEKEPDRISILMPNPGYTEEITNRTINENKMLIDQYKVPDDQILYSAAADVVGTLQKLDCGFERFHDENVYYLCCGTKPHSLALAIRGCLIDESAVIYNKPEFYKYRPIKHQGNYWLYQVRNLAVFV